MVEVSKSTWQGRMVLSLEFLEFYACLTWQAEDLKYGPGLHINNCGGVGLRHRAYGIHEVPGSRLAVSHSPVKIREKAGILRKKPRRGSSGLLFRNLNLSYDNQLRNPITI